MEGAVDGDTVLQVTNAITNTIQVIGLAYIAYLVQRESIRTQRKVEHESRRDEV